MHICLMRNKNIVFLNNHGFHDFDRYTMGLIEENEMIDDLIIVMNELWTEINYQN